MGCSPWPAGLALSTRSSATNGLLVDHRHQHAQLERLLKHEAQVFENVRGVFGIEEGAQGVEAVPTLLI